MTVVFTAVYVRIKSRAHDKARYRFIVRTGEKEVKRYRYNYLQKSFEIVIHRS